jgi:hypothetical protein
VNEYRVTKYNPAFRDPYGGYTKEEWTIFKQVGDTFSGVTFTLEEYERVENAYVDVALAFISEGNVSAIMVRGPENRGQQQNGFTEGNVLSFELIDPIIRRILREEIWCRLEGNGGFLHFDWDYYMYVGVPHPCPAAEARASELGLYVEECASPIGESVREREAEAEAETES